MIGEGSLGMWRHFFELFVSKRYCVIFVGFGGSIDLAAILDFVDSGHDLIIAADTNASDLIREIATECGVDFDEVLITFFSICPCLKVYFSPLSNSIQYFRFSVWLNLIFLLKAAPVRRII